MEFSWIAVLIYLAVIYKALSRMLGRARGGGEGRGRSPQIPARPWAPKPWAPGPLERQPWDLEPEDDEQPPLKPDVPGSRGPAGDPQAGSPAAGTRAGTAVPTSAVVPAGAQVPTRAAVKAGSEEDWEDPYWDWEFDASGAEPAGSLPDGVPSGGSGKPGAPDRASFTKPGLSDLFDPRNMVIGAEILRPPLALSPRRPGRLRF
ncbi:MAG: hypothetical protein HYY09_06580 [Firmicutes bacterium]|nr:hypothetical protein [Bacillota bacterium]